VIFIEKLNPSTPITVSKPARSFAASEEDYETTWGEFVADNVDDPEVVADIERQIAERNFAEVGGGAAPTVWVFA